MVTIADQVLRAAPRTQWSGTVHRSHGPRWSGDDAGGSLGASGRWHIGTDDPAGRQPFPVLYTATSQAVAIAERLRHLATDTVATMQQGLRMAISRLEIALPSVMDLRSPKQIGVPQQAFLGSTYEDTQHIAAAAYADGLSGLLVPTATGLGAADGDFNVIVFYELTGVSTVVYGLSIPTTAPRAGSIVRVVGLEELNLPP